jgi:hypothetical protein
MALYHYVDVDNYMTSEFANPAEGVIARAAIHQMQDDLYLEYMRKDYEGRNYTACGIKGSFCLSMHACTCSCIVTVLVGSSAYYITLSTVVVR